MALPTASGPVRPEAGHGEILSITPATADWRFLSCSVVDLAPGERWIDRSDDCERAIVTLSGRGEIAVGDVAAEVARTSVFEQMGRLVYAPPGVDATIETSVGLTVAIGSAPAEGRYPPRVVEPAEVRNEIRGGGAAYRQVVHSLAAPLPAERLIVYEVYVPRGTWSGWPPHCHDGCDGSPYLEETYYFRLDRPEGFGIHRNWRVEDDYDDTVVANDGDVVLVPKGYHSSVACPGANMYFLNFLAGELLDENRGTPPCFHADHTWIEADWTAGERSLPMVRP